MPTSLASRITRPHAGIISVVVVLVAAVAVVFVYVYDELGSVGG
jgi:preprotein translocase subunit SecE